MDEQTIGSVALGLVMLVMLSLLAVSFLPRAAALAALRGRRRPGDRRGVGRRDRGPSR